MLLEEYYECIPKVGPMKKFRNNVAMWAHISEEIKKKLGSIKTPDQCCTK